MSRIHQAEPEPSPFEDEKTSPEVVRAGRARPSRARATGESDPVALVAALDTDKRRKLAELLWADGWNAIEAGHAEELVTLCRRFSPDIVLIDIAIHTAGGMTLPEVVHAANHEASTRVIGLLPLAESMSATMAAALADGYDDFIVDASNDVEVVARAAANLRAVRVRDELQRQRRDAALLLELSQTLASSLDMQLILHTVSGLIAQVVSLERCSIILLDPNRDEAVMVAASEDRTVRDIRINLSNYPELQSCVQRGAPVLIEDAMTDPLLSSVQTKLVEKGVRTMALFPIVFEKRVTGVLFLRSSRPVHQISDSEIQFGQTVASACAVAVRNARLFDQFRDQNERINSMRVIAERQTETLRKYQDFFEYAADGMAIIDVDGHVLYVNKEGRRLFGRTREDMPDVRFQDLILEESRERWNDVVEQVRHGRFKRSFDVFVHRADGGERVFSLSAGGGGPEPGLLIVSFRDVTETREMEGELRTTKEFLENLIDNSVDAIVAADMNGNIMLFNKGAERLYGYRADDVIGKMHMDQLYPPGVSDDVMMMLRDDRWGGRGRLEAQRREIVTLSGDQVPVSMTASLIYEDGDEVATVGVYTDLRDRMAIERQLSEARDQLTNAERARVAAELAGMAAHELNQPLTSVLGYADMLKNRIPESDVRLRRPVDTIFKQAERMAEIVRKIGRITKYETTRYGLNTDMIDLDRATSSGEPVPPAEVTGGAPSQPAAVVPMFASTSPAASAPEGAKGFLRALASMPGRSGAAPSSPSSFSAAAAADPRAAIVRLDTVDDEPVGYERRLREQERERMRQAKAEHEAVPDPTTSPPRRSGASPSQTPVSRSAALTSGMDADDKAGDTNPGVKLSDLKKS